MLTRRAETFNFFILFFDASLAFLCEHLALQAFEGVHSSKRFVFCKMLPLKSFLFDQHLVLRYIFDAILLLQFILFSFMPHYGLLFQ